MGVLGELFDPTRLTERVFRLECSARLACELLQQGTASGQGEALDVLRAGPGPARDTAQFPLPLPAPRSKGRWVGEAV
jgi:hypothetical protein